MTLTPADHAETLVPGLKVLPWDGFHDLSNAEELRGMVAGFLERGERVAVLQKTNGDWQVGWRHRNGRFRDVWGMPLPTAPRALEDATRRFWKAIKGEDIHRHYPPLDLLKGCEWSGVELTPVLDTATDLKCPHCGKTGSTPSGPAPYRCSGCNRSFSKPNV